jgi:hypothetical protein
MSDLQNYSLQDIENVIMLILCANDGVIFSQYQLFNKVVDKIHENDKSSAFTIHPSFKAKYFIVVKNLMSSFNDVFVNKINDEYKISYNTTTEKLNQPEIIYNHIDDKTEISININHDLDNSYYYDYVVNNNIEKEFNSRDINNGNSFYHDIMNTSNNYLLIKKLIDDNNFKFNIKNHSGNTPILLNNNLNLTNLFINELFTKIDSLEKELFALQNKDIIDKIGKLSFYQFTKIKFIKFYIQNKNNIIFIFSILLIVIIAHYFNQYDIANKFYTYLH